MREPWNTCFNWLSEFAEWLLDLVKLWQGQITGGILAALVAVLEHYPNAKGEAQAMIWSFFKWWLWFGFLCAAFQQWRGQKIATQADAKELKRLAGQNKDLDEKVQGLSGFESEVVSLRRAVAAFEAQRITKREEVLRATVEGYRNLHWSARTALYKAKADELDSNDDLVWVCDLLQHHIGKHPFWGEPPTEGVPVPVNEEDDFTGYIRPKHDWLPFLKRMRLGPIKIESDVAFGQFLVYDRRFDGIPDL